MFSNDTIFSQKAGKTVVFVFDQNTLDKVVFKNLGNYSDSIKFS